MDEVLAGVQWDVSFRWYKNVLRAEVAGTFPSLDIEYAFYLMRGGDLIEKAWYSGASAVDFERPRIGGRYRVVAFVRVVGSRTPVRKSSDVLDVEGAVLYDLSQWRAPVYFHEAIRGWKGGVAPADGVHRFACGTGHIDIRADGMAQLKKGGSVLVHFGGAVPGRAHKTAPFFSGMGVAHKSALPILAVSDPSLALSNSLALAWYAGNAGMPELPRNIAQILDLFAEAFGVRLILFGGSGGGFASLAVQTFLNSPSVAFVWNPQTSIARYHANAVRAFARIAWGAGDSGYEEACSVVKNSCLLHDVTTSRISAEHSVLYIQNRSDTFHVESHAAEYFRQHGLSFSGGGVYLVDCNLVAWLGDWGVGHVVPPAGMIVHVLKSLASSSHLPSVISDLVQSSLSKWSGKARLN